MYEEKKGLRKIGRTYSGVSFYEKPIVARGEIYMVPIIKLDGPRTPEGMLRKLKKVGKLAEELAEKEEEER